MAVPGLIQVLALTSTYNLAKEETRSSVRF
jgi:hypothetical protein